MILIPSSVEVEFAAGGFGLVRGSNELSEQGRLRPIGQILPDVLARYGIAAEPLLPGEGHFSHRDLITPATSR